MNYPEVFSVGGCRNPFTSNFPKVSTAKPTFEFDSDSKNVQLYFLHVSSCCVVHSRFTA